MYACILDLIGAANLAVSPALAAGRRRLVLTGIVVLALPGAGGCGSNGPTESGPHSTVISLTIGGDRSLTVGESNQLSAEARLLDGTSRDVAGSAAWQSSDAAIATVSGSGVVVAVTTGTVTVSATYRGKSDHATVTVIPVAPTVTAVTITGTKTITVGQTTQLTLTAILSDGSERDATALAIWQSTRPTFATVSGTGIVAALNPGTVVVTAAYQGQVASLTMVVTAISLDMGTPVEQAGSTELSRDEPPSP